MTSKKQIKTVVNKFIDNMNDATHLWKKTYEYQYDNKEHYLRILASDGIISEIKTNSYSIEVRHMPMFTRFKLHAAFKKLKETFVNNDYNEMIKQIPTIEENPEKFL